MTISTTSVLTKYSGNGVTTQFSVSYQLTDENDLTLFVTNTTSSAIQGVPANTTAQLAKGADYTVSLQDGGDSGAIVDFNFAPETGLVITIYRSLPLTQQVDYTPNSAFPAETHEEALDRLTLIAQQLSEQASRAFKIGVGDALGKVDPTLAPGSTLSDAVLTLDSNGRLASTPFSQTGVTSWNGLTGPVSVTTDDLPEGSTNLYFTSERAQDAVGPILAGAGGITVTYNDAGPSITVNFTGDTSNVPEGSNLYFTDERAQDAAWTVASGGDGVAVNYDDAGNAATISATLGNGLGFDGSRNIAVGLAGGLLYSGTTDIAVNPGNGITLVSGKVTASLGNGLEFDGGAIEPSLGNGLQFSGGSFAVDLGNGLEFSGNEVQVRLANGLDFTGTAIFVDLGAGLQYDANSAVAINAGDGLEFSGDVLIVSLGTGLQFSGSNDIEVTSPVARTDQNNVFESRDNGGQQTIKGGFPNIFLYEDDSTNENARLEVRGSGTYHLRSVEDDGSTNATTRWSTDLGTGNHDAEGGRIANVGSPTNSADAATKSYVDSNSASITEQTITHSSSGTLTVDLSSGRYVAVVLEADVTDITVLNASNADSFVLLFSQSNGGGHTVTWPTEFDWPHGTTLQLTDTDGAIDIFQAITISGGTTWYIQAMGLDFQ